MVATAIAAALGTAPRLSPGATVVCLAPGPSLTAEDVAYVHGKAPVIAVNDAVTLAPWADVFYSSDNYWLPNHQGLPAFQGRKFAVMPSPPKATHNFGPDVTVLANTGETGLDLSPDGLRTGRNSGYAAIGLAVHFGAARILLLGYDMGPGRYAHFVKAFDALVEPLQVAGVEVLNCSRRSGLTQFPARLLCEVLL